MEAMNGSENSGDGPSVPSMASIQKPIGFYTAAQLAQMGISPANPSGQVWTDVDMGKTTVFDDRHTVEHTYIRGGRSVSVHYTMRMVNSRIAQYQRDIEDCKQRGLGTEVLQNRENWLVYWQNKRAELLIKMEKTKNCI